MYAALKERVLYRRPGHKLRRKRSHGRLKAYSSEEDVRAWSLNRGDRRRAFIDLINNQKTTFGNYIPVENLLQILQIAENRKLLSETVKKLEAVNHLLNGADEEPLTESEENIRKKYYGEDKGCDEKETIRNLRCLVQDLYEAQLYYQDVRNERDQLLQLSSCRQVRQEELLNVENERNCLKVRVQGLEGIEKRMLDLVTEHEETLKELRCLRAKFRNNPTALEMHVLKQKAAEADKMEQELILYKSKAKEWHRTKLELEALSRENRELRCALADQEDEIKQLINTTDHLSESADKRQERMRSCLNQLQGELKEKVDQLLRAQCELVCTKEYVAELEHIRTVMKKNTAELTENKEYLTGICEAQRSEIEKLSSMKSPHQILTALSDPRGKCEEVTEALAAAKEASKKLLEDYNKEKEINRCLQFKLDDMKEKFDIACTEISSLTTKLPQQPEREATNTEEPCTSGAVQKPRETPCKDSSNDTELRKEIASLQQTNENLRNEVCRLEESEREKAALQNQICSLEKVICALRAELCAAQRRSPPQPSDQRTACLENKVRNLECQNNQLNQEKCKLCEELNCLKQKDERNEKKIASLDKELCVVKADILNVCRLKKEKEKEACQLKERLEKACKDLNCAKENIGCLETRLDKEREEKERISEELDNLKPQLADALTAKDHLQRANRTLMEDMDCMKLQLEESVGELRASSRRAGEGRAERDKALQDLREARRTIICKDEIISGLELQVNKLKCQLQNAQHELNKVSEQLVEMKCNFETIKCKLELSEKEKNTLSDEMNKLNCKLNNIYGEKEASTSQLISAVGESESLKRTIEGLEEELGRMTKLNMNLECEVLACKQANKVMQDDVNKLKEDLMHANEEKCKIKCEIGRKNREIDDIKQELEKMTNLYHNEQKLADCLKKTMCSMQSKIGELEERLARAEAEWEMTKRSLEISEGKIKCYEEELEKTQNELDDMTRKTAKLTADLEKQEGVNRALEGELEKANDQLSSLQRTHDDLEKELEGVNDKLASNELQLAIANKNLKETEKLNNSLTADLRYKEDEMEALQKERRELKVQLEKTSEALSKTEHGLNRAKSEAADLQKALDETEEKLNEATDQNKKFEDELGDAQRKLSSAEEEKEEYLKRMTVEEERIKKLESEKGALQQEQETLRRNSMILEKERDDMKKKEETDKLDCRKLMDEMAGMEAKLARMTELEKELGALRKSCKAGEESLRKKEDENKDLMEEIEVLKKALETTENAMKELQQEMHRLKEEMRRVQDENKALMGENAAVHGLQELITKIAGEKKALELAIENLKKGEENLKRQIRALDNQILDLNTKISTLNTTIKCLEEDKKKNIAEIASLNALVKQLEEAKKDLEQKLETCQEDNVFFQAKICELKSTLCTIKDSEPEDNEINRILKKIMTSGWQQCSLEELALLHQEECTASDRLVVCGEDKRLMEKMENRSTPLPQVKRELLKRVSALKSELQHRECEAQQRSSQLSAAMQQYKAELSSMKNEKGYRPCSSNKDKMESGDGQHVKPQSSKMNEKRLQHYIGLAEKEKKKAEIVESNMQKAVQCVEKVQATVVSESPEKLKDLQIQECLKNQLIQASGLLNLERQKSACLQYQLCLAQKGPPQGDVEPVDLAKDCDPSCPVYKKQVASADSQEGRQKVTKVKFSEPT